MPNRLKQHRKAKDKERLLIVCTFAITAIPIAWLSKKVSDVLRLDIYRIFLVGMKSNSFNFWVPGNYSNGGARRDVSFFPGV